MSEGPELDPLRQRFQVKTKKEPRPADPRVAWIALILGLVTLAVAATGTYLIFELQRKADLRSEDIDAQLEELELQIDEINDQLAARLEQGLQETKAELNVVRERVGATRQEIARTRQQTEEQGSRVQSLSSQIQTKADVTDVSKLETKSEAKFDDLGEQIEGVQQDLQASRDDLEKTIQELNSLGLKITEQGQLIAVNQGGLEELRRRGERDYLEFDARKNNRIAVAGIALELRKTNRSKQHANLRLYYDDRTVERKNLYTNTPLVFYVGAERVSYELVILEVERDRIKGYVSLPKEQAPAQLQLQRKG